MGADYVGPSFTIRCRECGDEFTTGDVARLAEWDKDHACFAAARPVTEGDER